MCPDFAFLGARCWSLHGSFSSCRRRGGAPPGVTGPPPPPALLPPPFLWICSRLLPVGDGDVTVETDSGKESFCTFEH